MSDKDWTLPDTPADHPEPMTDEESKRLLDRLYGRKKDPSVKEKIEETRKEFNRDQPPSD